MPSQSKKSDGGHRSKWDRQNDFVLMDMKVAREALRIFRSDTDIARATEAALGSIMSDGVRVVETPRTFRTPPAKGADISPEMKEFIEHRWTRFIRQMAETLAALGFAAFGFRAVPKNKAALREIDPNRLLIPVVLDLEFVDVAFRTDCTGQLDYRYSPICEENKNTTPGAANQDGTASLEKEKGKQKRKSRLRTLDMYNIATMTMRRPDRETGCPNVSAVRAVVEARRRLEQVSQLAQLSREIRARPPLVFIKQQPNKHAADMQLIDIGKHGGVLGEGLQNAGQLDGDEFEPGADDLLDNQLQVQQNDQGVAYNPNASAIDFEGPYRHLQSQHMRLLQQIERGSTFNNMPSNAWFSQTMPHIKLPAGQNLARVIRSDSLAEDVASAESAVQVAAYSVFGMTYGVGYNRPNGDKKRTKASVVGSDSFKTRRDLGFLKDTLEEGATNMVSTLLNDLLPTLSGQSAGGEQFSGDLPEGHLDEQKRIAIVNRVLKHEVALPRFKVVLVHQLDHTELAELHRMAPYIEATSLAHIVAQTFGVPIDLLRVADEDQAQKKSNKRALQEKEDYSSSSSSSSEDEDKDQDNDKDYESRAKSKEDKENKKSKSKKTKKRPKT